MRINFDSIIDYVRKHPDECNVEFDEDGSFVLENNLICLDCNGNVLSVTPKNE